jgi:hypothetical protein
MSGFRAPTDPALILRERRPDVTANQAGHGGPVNVTELSEAQRRLFDRQLAAYLAAARLADASSENVLYGIPVQPDLVTVWLIARARWHWAAGH